MRKTLLGLAALAMVALATPRMASAGVSVSIGLPGVYVGGYFPAPPVAYPYPYAPPVYYRPYYGSYGYYGGGYRCGYGRGYGYGYGRGYYRGGRAYYGRYYR
jgi:hypothetical protein